MAHVNPGNNQIHLTGVVKKRVGECQGGISTGKENSNRTKKSLEQKSLGGPVNLNQKKQPKKQGSKRDGTGRVHLASMSTCKRKKDRQRST